MKYKKKIKILALEINKLRSEITTKTSKNEELLTENNSLRIDVDDYVNILLLFFSLFTLIRKINTSNFAKSMIRLQRIFLVQNRKYMLIFICLLKFQNNSQKVNDGQEKDPKNRNFKIGNILGYTQPATSDEFVTPTT